MRESRPRLPPPPLRSPSGRLRHVYYGDAGAVERGSKFGPFVTSRAGADSRDATMGRGQVDANKKCRPSDAAHCYVLMQLGALRYATERELLWKASCVVLV